MPRNCTSKSATSVCCFSAVYKVQLDTPSSAISVNSKILDAGAPEYTAGTPGFCKAGLTSAMPRNYALCAALSEMSRDSIHLLENLFLCKFLILQGFAKCFCFNWFASPFCSQHYMPEMEPHLCRCGNNTEPRWLSLVRHFVFIEMKFPFVKALLRHLKCRCFIFSPCLEDLSVVVRSI